MADYARIRTIIEWSKFSDYSKRQLDPMFEVTAEKKVAMIPVNAGASAVSVALSGFSSVDWVLAVNYNTTNAVELQWDHLRGQVSPPDIDFDGSGNPDTISDGQGSPDAVWVDTYNAAAGQYVHVSGADLSANDGVFLLQAATNTVLTLGTGESLSTSTGDTEATLSFLRRNRMAIPSSTTATESHVLLYEPWPTTGLTIYGVSAEDVELYVVGD